MSILSGQGVLTSDLSIDSTIRVHGEKEEEEEEV